MCSLAHLLPGGGGGASWSLICAEGRGVSRGSGQRRGLGGLPNPSVVLCAGGMRSTLLLFLTPCFCSWLFRSGSWVIWSLYLVVHDLPQLRMHTVTFSPLYFLCILLLEETFVLVQALQRRVPGPSLSQDSWVPFHMACPPAAGWPRLFMWF